MRSSRHLSKKIVHVVVANVVIVRSNVQDNDEEETMKPCYYLHHGVLFSRDVTLAVEVETNKYRTRLGQKASRSGTLPISRDELRRG